MFLLYLIVVFPNILAVILTPNQILLKLTLLTVQLRDHTRSVINLSHQLIILLGLIKEPVLTRINPPHSISQIRQQLHLLRLQCIDLEITVLKINILQRVFF